MTVEDLRTEDGHELYLVRPDATADGSAVLYLHWFDEAPNANRTQYLEEAKRLAEVGVVSVLPQLTFPWHSAPTDTDQDLSRIKSELEFLHAAHAFLSDTEGVDNHRIAVVGHDFGAMYGIALLGHVELRAAVFVAATPRWADWFLRFWPIASDRYDYMRALSAVDPITTISKAACPLLFQYGKTDFYIAPMTGLELFQAAPEPKQVLNYDGGHEMDLEAIRHDRIVFLAESLGFNL